MADSKTRHADAALQTPTDLPAKSTAAIAHALNGLVADAFALYIKTKNFHWHMSGPHFRDYHLMLDEQGEQIFATIDPLAERVRKLGQRTLHSVGEVAKRTTIAGNDDEFVPPAMMLSELIADNKAMTASLRAAHKVCDEAEDVGSASLLEVYIDETERRTWFLFEAARTADNTGH